MKTIAYALVALVSVVATTGCEEGDSMPQDGAEPGAETAEVDAPSGERAARMNPLLRYDADENGIVTLAEFDAARLVKFSEADADNNQLLEGDELKGLHSKHGERGKRGKHGKRGDHGDHFERADTNSDGFVTEAEVVASAGEKFAHLDDDSDGFLTEGENPHMRGKRGKGGDPEAQSERLAEVDTDGDGKISQAEFAAKLWTHMSKLDTDGDARVSLEEAKAGKELMRERHAEMREGKGQAREGKGAMRGKRGLDGKRGGKMAMLDGDGDGAVSLDEYKKMGAEMFARIDADQSQTLEGEELNMRGKRGKRGEH